MQEVRHRVDAQVHAEVTEVLGLVTENLSPNIGVEAVGADYEIEHAGVAVAERDFNAVTGLGDRGDGVAEYHVDAGRPRHEDLE
jgi:predicted RecB family endonuclease